MFRLFAVLFLFVTIPAIAQSTDDLPDGAGKPVVQKMCAGCHKMRVVTSKHATRDQWATIVEQMVSRGANGTDEEIEIVIDYLAKSFPPVEKKADPAPPSLRGWIARSQWDLDALSKAWRGASN